MSAASQPALLMLCLAHAENSKVHPQLYYLHHQTILSQSSFLYPLVQNYLSLVNFYHNRSQSQPLHLGTQLQVSKICIPHLFSWPQLGGGFGPISSSHSFIEEPIFDNIVIHILKSNLLNHEDHVYLVLSSPIISTL